MTMHLRPDDPRITAYHLGELSNDDALSVERAAASDPAVRLALRETGKLSGFLSDTLGPAGVATLRPAQRAAILRAGRDGPADDRVVELASARRSLRPWLTGLAAAAAVAFAAVLMSRFGDDPGRSGGAAREVALLPQPGPAAGTGATGVAGGGGAGASGGAATEGPDRGDWMSVARELERGPLPEPHNLPATGRQADFSTSPELRLPVVVGTTSAIWVRRWIEENDSLPPASAVRVEEMINTITLPAAETRGGLKVGLRSLDWGGSRWIGVQLVAGDREISDLVVVSESGSPRRVVGSFGRRDDASLATSLDAGRATLVLLEFQGEGATPGRLRLAHGGETGAFDLETGCAPGGAALRHAVAMTVFGRWLRGETSIGELHRVIDFAEEVPHDPVHERNHQLIRRAVALAGDRR